MIFQKVLAIIDDMNKGSQSILQLENISKVFPGPGGVDTFALRNVNLQIDSGEFVCIMGPSGSGKSTLSNIIGLLDAPSTGQMIFGGEQCDGFTDDERTLARNRHVGFIFQDYLLIEHMNTLENTILSLHCHQMDPSECKALARDLLIRVGLEDHLHKLPRQLSGGQRQRTAVARALVKSPRLIVADEPTGALDKASRIEVLQLFQSLNQEGATIVMVTHSEEDAMAASRIVSIEDAEIVRDEKIESKAF